MGRDGLGRVGTNGEGVGVWYARDVVESASPVALALPRGVLGDDKPGVDSGLPAWLEPDAMASDTKLDNTGTAGFRGSTAAHSKGGGGQGAGGTGRERGKHAGGGGVTGSTGRGGGAY
jgi:hypothetical protein